MPELTVEEWQAGHAKARYVRIRGRYVVPSQILDSIAEEALASGLCVDVADYVLTRRPPDRTR